jgi:hypothetical protein
MIPSVSSLERADKTILQKEPRRISLPRIEKTSSVVRKALQATRLLPWIERWGIYRGSWMPNPSRSYGEAFRDRYYVKSYFSSDQQTFMPPFPLQQAHPGQRFVILGNGPSLKKFDFSRIKNVVTLGTNTASEFYHADYVLIGNAFAFLRAQPFIDLNRSRLLITGSLWNGPARQDVWKGFEDRVIPFEVGDGDWSIEQGRIVGFGVNAGQLAVDVALLMGASSILLVGCDGYKNRHLGEMYAGRYNNPYRQEMATPTRLNRYEKMLWERDEEVHRLFERKQQYCEKRGIRFGVWGSDCRYERLRRIQDSELSEWC